MGGAVQNFSKVLRFGWKYMRPYWTRLVLGIVFGILCGLTAASFIWATRTLAERLERPEVVAAEAAATATKAETPKEKGIVRSLPADWQAQAERLKASTDRFLDEWLPRAGSTMTTNHLIGGIL